MRYILALVMHFKDREQRAEVRSQMESILHRKLVIVLLATGYWLLATIACAEVIDRVVAYVDDTAITLSEFHESYSRMKNTTKDITEGEIINSMINRLLLIKEAKKMKLEARTDEELLRDYIDIKIRSLILIKEDTINKFYLEHINKFNDKDYLSVRDEIEKYLFELETNNQLKKHLEELKANADVKIQLLRN